MNRRGNPETLVASQPGNKNALRSGVYSPNALAPRVHQIEAAIAERRVDEVLRDISRREVAALAALGEAMDADLAANGLIGRRGEPRRMIEHRLRLNAKLQQTIERFALIHEAEQPGDKVATGTPDPRPTYHLTAMAEVHKVAPGKILTPSIFDPEVFLYWVVTSDDPATTTADRLRARKLLTKRRRAQPATCTCIATLRASDALEFRDWVDAARATGAGTAPYDAWLAARVRAVARGDLDEAGPYYSRRRMVEAVEAVVAAATSTAAADRNQSDELDPAEKPFWDTLVSRSRRTRTKERLDAFVALDELEVIARCRCDAPKERELVELRADALEAYIVRMVAANHYRAALVVAEHPETYLAVRDAIDHALLAQPSTDNETASA